MNPDGRRYANRRIAGHIEKNETARAERVSARSTSTAPARQGRRGACARGTSRCAGARCSRCPASNPRNSSCLTVSANSVLEPPMACPAVGSGPIAQNPGLFYRPRSKAFPFLLPETAAGRRSPVEIPSRETRTASGCAARNTPSGGPSPRRTAPAVMPPRLAVTPRAMITSQEACRKREGGVPLRIAIVR